MAPVTGADDGTTGYGVAGSSPSAIGVRGTVGEPLTELHGADVEPVQAGIVGYGYRIFEGPLFDHPPSPPTYGVYGASESGGDGVFGTGTNGVHGSSRTTGSSTAPPRGAGVWGESDAGSGVYGSAATGAGIFGTSTGYDGVHGETSAARHAGVSGINNARGIGVFGSSAGGNAGHFEGDCYVAGTHSVAGDVVLVNQSAQDCAEDFDVTDGDLAPGTVVVMSADGSESVRPCDSDYATTVVGIISGAGGLQPGLTLGRRSSVTPRMPVALMGRVYCKVDASRSPVNVGDLLTTSTTLGHAMRAIDPSRAFGSVIGKALSSLHDGKGMIPVLVALQ